MVLSVVPSAAVERIDMAAPDLETRLAAYFSSQPEVVFAYLFFFFFNDTATTESDVDIAIYLTNGAAVRTLPDVEEPRAELPSEQDIWAEVERISGTHVDLVVLNRAPAAVAAGAMLTGRLLHSTDRDFRRSVERWVENLVNASIDAAKIVLASERRPVPQTYRETLEMLSTVDGFRDRTAVTRRLAENSRIRNMLVHEYLELRYTQVNAVMDGAAATYGALAEGLRTWMTP